jgi:putative ABC transport system permease protein
MRRDVVFAVRQMTRQPALSLAAILTLGLGLGASLAVFTLVNAVLLRPLPYPDAERVLAIGRGDAHARQSMSHRDADFLRAHIRTCGPIATTVSGSGLNVLLNGATSYQSDRLVSHHFFPALGIAPQWGRGFTAQDDTDVPAPVVVLNERFVRQSALEPGALVGQDIELAGRTHTIIGILSAAHTRPSDADIFRPLGRDARGGGQNLTALCRLASGASAAALNAELGGLLEEGRRQKLVGERETIAYSAITQHEWEFGSLRPQLNTLLFAVALVLLAAAANTTGLLLVRAAGRRREIAVRSALGAAPSQIARSLIIEGLVLAGVAGALGLIAAPVLVRGLLAAAPAYYGELAAFDIDAAVVAAALLLCAVVGLLVALPPLLEVLRVNLRDTLQEEGRSGTPGRRTAWLRQLLIAAETAVCAVLLVGALLLLRTFVNLMNVDPGIDTRGVITARISIQGPRYEDVTQLIHFFEQGVARLEQLPSIESAAVGASLPGERALNLPATFPDSPDPEQVRVVNWRYVTPEYFSLLRMRLVTGRLFTSADRGGNPPVALINEAFAAQLFGGRDQALGRRIAVGSVREVVGVVSDTAGWTLGDAPRPMMFVPLAQVEARVARTAHAFFPPRWIVRARDVSTARRELAAIVREVDPTQPFIDVHSLDAMMLNSVGMQRFYFVVLAAFAGFAVLLAAVGIYATYSYAIAGRTAEIGVRLALGASPGAIVAGIVWRAVFLGGMATGAGLVGAAAGARVLESLLFGVSAADPFTYAAVAVVLLGTVTLATLMPAMRAAKIDPLVALRR